MNFYSIHILFSFFLHRIGSKDSACAKILIMFMNIVCFRFLTTQEELQLFMVVSADL